MPTPTKGPRLGGSPAHERLLLANLATALFEHGRITTTHAKAKRLRPLAERLITFAKRGDLHARRQVLTVVRDKGVVHTLFAEIGPRYDKRAGGYTRIVKIGPRKGDNAPMAVIELIEAETAAQAVVGEAERSRGTRFAPRRRKKSAGSGAQAPGADVAVADEPTEDDDSVDRAPTAVADADETDRVDQADPGEAESDDEDSDDESTAPTDGKSDPA